jgi:hypothetical protein
MIRGGASPVRPRAGQTNCQQADIRKGFSARLRWNYFYKLLEIRMNYFETRKPHCACEDIFESTKIQWTIPRHL